MFSCAYKVQSWLPRPRVVPQRPTTSNVLQTPQTCHILDRTSPDPTRSAQLTRPSLWVSQPLCPLGSTASNSCPALHNTAVIVDLTFNRGNRGYELSVSNIMFKVLNHLSIALLVQQLWYRTRYSWYLSMPFSADPLFGTSLLIPFHTTLKWAAFNVLR